VPRRLVHYGKVLEAGGRQQSVLCTPRQHNGEIVFGRTRLLNSPDNVPYRPDRRVLQLEEDLHKRYVEKERLRGWELRPHVA
jgi:hypothetical protein